MKIRHIFGCRSALYSLAILLNAAGNAPAQDADTYLDRLWACDDSEYLELRDEAVSAVPIQQYVSLRKKTDKTHLRVLAGVLIDHHALRNRSNPLPATKPVIPYTRIRSDRFRRYASAYAERYRRHPYILVEMVLRPRTRGSLRGLDFAPSALMALELLKLDELCFVAGEVLQDSTLPDDRMYAARALARRNCRESVPELLKILASSEEGVVMISLESALRTLCTHDDAKRISETVADLHEGEARQFLERLLKKLQEQAPPEGEQ